MHVKTTLRLFDMLGSSMPPNEVVLSLDMVENLSHPPLLSATARLPSACGQPRLSQTCSDHMGKHVGTHWKRAPLGAAAIRAKLHIKSHRICIPLGRFLQPACWTQFLACLTFTLLYYIKCKHNIHLRIVNIVHQMSVCTVQISIFANSLQPQLSPKHYNSNANT